MIKKLLVSIFRKVNNTVFRNLLLIGGLGVLIKVVSFYKETLISASFGLSILLDTFYLAILIPSFIQLMALRALKNLFIPNYILEMKTTKEIGSLQAFIFIVITILFLFLSTFALVFSLFIEDFFSGQSVEYYELLRKQLYIVLPCILLWGYSSVLDGLLEIDNKFFHSTIVQVFVPIITIINVLLFKDFFGETILVWSMLIGTLLSFFYLILMTKKFSLLKFAKVKINDNTRLMIRQYPPKVTSAILTGINPFVDKMFAAQLVVGSVASINYGVKLPTILTALLMLALGKVFLPYFSRAIVDDKKKAYFRLFSVLKVVFISAFFVSAIFYFWSHEIIELLFERGEFTSNDTLVVGNIQKIAFLYVPFYLCTLICVKFLTADNKNKFMAWVSFWNLVINLTMNFILIKAYGLYGLVMSTTIVYIISSLIYFTYTYNCFKKFVRDYE